MNYKFCTKRKKINGLEGSGLKKWFKTNKKMIRKNITIAFRNLRKHKFFSIVNIVGLALGLAASFFLLLYILNETGYDKCHAKRDRIYRMLENNADVKIHQPNVPMYFAENLKKDFPEVETTASTRRIWGVSIQKGENQITERNVYGADPSVFDIFTFPIIVGNKNNFLQEPNSVVISEKIAEKFFGDENPLGKELKMRMMRNDETYILKVDGVFKSCKKTTFNAEILLHTNMIWERSKLFFDEKSNYLKGSFSTTYVLLKEGVNISFLQEKMPDFKKKYADDKNKAEYTFQALTDVYFNSRGLQNGPDWGDLHKLYTFSYIALLILFIACANYIILSIAQSSTRFKEIGVRKLVGATPKMLKTQILTESMLVSFIAVPISLLIMELALPIMNEMLQTQMKVHYLSNWKFVVGFILISLLVGLLSGAYLSFFLSGLNPIAVFTNKSNTRNARSYFRMALIAFQIIVFVVLLIFVQTISLQLKYAINGERGFEKENIEKVFVDDDFSHLIPQFVEEIKKSPNIINATAAFFIPPNRSSSRVRYRHFTNPDQKVAVEVNDIDYDFVETMGIEILEGRNFSKDFPSDTTNSFLISKSAVKAFGFIESPVGERIAASDSLSYEVIGVFKDIYMRSFKKSQMPTVISLIKSYKYINEIAYKYREGTEIETKAYVKKVFKEIFPESNFESISVEHNLKLIYVQEAIFKFALYIFIALAIFISMLGLFALSLFMIKQRAKDIGIRKVYGARTLDIIKVIIKEFIILVVIANIVAIPIGYYFSNQWLSEYAYRVDFSFLPYLISFILSVILVSITVTLSAIKTSNINPVDSINIQN